MPSISYTASSETLQATAEAGLSPALYGKRYIVKSLYVTPSLMSSSNMIRKQCHLGAKVEECTSEVDFRTYKCKKAVVIYLGTNNITTDGSPKTIASKLTEVGKVTPSTECSSPKNYHFWHHLQERH